MSRAAKGSGRVFVMRLLNCIFIATALFFYSQMMQMNQALELANKTIVEAAAAATAAQSATSGIAAVLPPGKYSDGTYEGTAQGYGGPVTIQIKVSSGNITAIEITSADKEDAAYYNMTLGILDDIMDTQGVDVDTVSGATFTSKGIINAAKEALAKATK